MYGFDTGRHTGYLYRVLSILLVGGRKNNRMYSYYLFKG